MGTLSIRLPESIHGQLKTVARKEGVSINQLINTAVAEKMSALLTEDYLAARAERGDRERFEGILAKIPGAEPDPSDSWENDPEE